MGTYDKYSIGELLREFKEKYIYLDSETVGLSQHTMEDYFGLDYILNKESQYSLYDNLFDKLIEPLLYGIEDKELKTCYFNNFRLESNKVILEFKSPSINLIIGNREIDGIYLKELKEYLKLRLEEEHDLGQEDISEYDILTLKEYKKNKGK